MTDQDLAKPINTTIEIAKLLLCRTADKYSDRSVQRVSNDLAFKIAEDFSAQLSELAERFTSDLQGKPEGKVVAAVDEAITIALVSLLFSVYFQRSAAALNSYAALAKFYVDRAQELAHTVNEAYADATSTGQFDEIVALFGDGTARANLLQIVRQRFEEMAREEDRKGEADDGGNAPLSK